MVDYETPASKMPATPGPHHGRVDRWEVDLPERRSPPPTACCGHSWWRRSSRMRWSVEAVTPYAVPERPQLGDPVVSRRQFTVPLAESATERWRPCLCPVGAASARAR